MGELLVKLGGKSRQAWFALLLVIAGALQDNSDVLAGVAGEEMSGTILYVIGVIVYILRAITKVPMGEKTKLLANE